MPTTVDGTTSTTVAAHRDGLGLFHRRCLWIRRRDAPAHSRRASPHCARRAVVAAAAAALLLGARNESTRRRVPATSCRSGRRSPRSPRTRARRSSRSTICGRARSTTSSFGPSCTAATTTRARTTTRSRCRRETARAVLLGSLSLACFPRPTSGSGCRSGSHRGWPLVSKFDGVIAGTLPLCRRRRRAMRSSTPARSRT